MERVMRRLGSSVQTTKVTYQDGGGRLKGGTILKAVYLSSVCGENSREVEKAKGLGLVGRRGGSKRGCRVTYHLSEGRDKDRGAEEPGKAMHRGGHIPNDRRTQNEFTRRSQKKKDTNKHQKQTKTRKHPQKNKKEIIRLSETPHALEAMAWVNGGRG